MKKVFHNSVCLPLIAVSLISVFFSEKEQAKRELAHVENKVEQFIVILRDIFEYFLRPNCNDGSDGKL